MHDPMQLHISKRRSNVFIRFQPNVTKRWLSRGNAGYVSCQSDKFCKYGTLKVLHGGQLGKALNLEYLKSG